MENEKTENIEAKDVVESSDEEIEVKPPKTKKERSEAQKQAFLKAQEIRKANMMKRKEEEQELEKFRKKELEEKIVKKAIQIKKKQIKEEKVIEPESESEDDEHRPSNYNTPRINEKPRVKPQQQQIVQRKIIFL